MKFIALLLPSLSDLVEPMVMLSFEADGAYIFWVMDVASAFIKQFNEVATHYYYKYNHVFIVVQSCCVWELAV